MTDPTLTSSPERTARAPRRAAPWLALVAVVLAVPLVLDLAAVAQDPLRGMIAFSGGALWAGVALALVLGLLVAALLRPARWLRLGIGLGSALAVIIVGAAVAWQQAGGALPAIQGCAQSVAPAGGLPLAAESSIDGARRAVLHEPALSTAESATGIARLTDELADVAVEDLGLERVIDRPTRHCRALVSGSQVTAALRVVVTGTADAQPLVPSNLPVWRGDFDWWVSAGGQLVGATFRVGGHPNDAWPDADGNLGLLTVELLPEPTPVQP